MSQWQLVGPRIPKRVWRNHLLIGERRAGVFRWRRFRKKDVLCFHEGARRGAPSLLVLHGTGLRSPMGLAGLSPQDFVQLEALYGPRILAFEHRAVRHHLDQNGRALVRHLESIGVALNLHVLGLSRGGLVARLLSEGWLAHSPEIQLQKIIFVGTPNEGSMSARWDRLRASELKVWRQDIRRLLLRSRQEGKYAAYADPYAITGPQDAPKGLRAWPMLNGTGDQLPGSAWLNRLNGFAGKPAHVVSPSCHYYGISSVFDFSHGAPNPLRRCGRRWEDIVHTVFGSTPNDLVVPTSGVYRPEQGPDACGRFPILAQRLLVLQPSCNATHIGILRIPRIRSQILEWLGERT